MADRNKNRDRRRNQPGNDWDYYYYQYTYNPYRGNDYYEPDYYTNNMYYGRNYDYNRNEFDQNMPNRDWDSGYYYGNDYYGNNEYGTQYGQYAGYGPRDYRRSDERILEDINDRLTWHSLIDATDINVAVSNGIVTLTGSVDTRQDKRLAEDIADDVPGVWDVDNRLSVRNKGYYRGWHGEQNRNEFRPGMEVVDKDDKHVGMVKDIRDGDFLLDRPMARDIYVPFRDCHIFDGKVHLDVASDQIENQGWMMPEAVQSQQKNR